MTPTIAKWLPIALLLFTGAVAWGANVTRIDGLDNRVTNMERKIDKLNDVQARIEERTNNTGNDVKDIKLSLHDLTKVLFDSQAK